MNLLEITHTFALRFKVQAKLIPKQNNSPTFDVRLDVLSAYDLESDMAKRHTSRKDDISSIVERLQELVIAHSGEDAFEEIFKMLIAKIFVESDAESNASLAYTGNADDVLLAFNRILARAHRKWPGILGDETECRLKAPHLAECLMVLSGATLTGADMEVLDHAFEYLVSQANKGSKGQYFTPRHVIECCIQMIDPKPGELILDPACGSGGFLFHALCHMRRAQTEKGAQSSLSEQLWGVDFDLRASRVAKALMILAEAPDAHIYRINSLIKKRKQSSLPGMIDSGNALTLEDAFNVSLPHFKGFDVIVTNPPFAGEITEAETLETYDVAQGAKRMERDVLFIERCVELLRPGGRLAMVVPHNKVGAAGFSDLRRWLMRHTRVISVLGLGRETFLPHTHQKTSVIICQKRRKPDEKPQDAPILFQVSTSSGKDSKGRLVQRPVTTGNQTLWERVEHDFQEVVSAFRTFQVQQNLVW